MEVFFGLLAIGVIIVFVFILRSVFRINDIVENQKKTVLLLTKLIELKKKEMGVMPESDVKSKK